MFYWREKTSSSCSWPRLIRSLLCPWCWFLSDEIGTERKKTNGNWQITKEGILILFVNEKAGNHKPDNDTSGNGEKSSLNSLYWPIESHSSLTGSTWFELSSHIQNGMIRASFPFRMSHLKYSVNNRLHRYSLASQWQKLYSKLYMDVWRITLDETGEYYWEEREREGGRETSHFSS